MLLLLAHVISSGLIHLSRIHSKVAAQSSYTQYLLITVVLLFESTVKVILPAV